MSRKSPSQGDHRGHNPGSQRHCFNATLTADQRRTILAIRDIEPLPKKKVPVGESRATFWNCKCGRRHKLRYESKQVCISICPLCEDYYRG